MLHIVSKTWLLLIRKRSQISKNIPKAFFNEHLKYLKDCKFKKYKKMCFPFLKFSGLLNKKVI